MEMTRKFNNCKGMEIWIESVQSVVRIRISAWNGTIVESLEHFSAPRPLPACLSGRAISRIAASNAGSDALSLCCALRVAIVRACEICGCLKLALNTIFRRSLKL